MRMKRNILTKNKIIKLSKYSKMFLYDGESNEKGFHIFDTEDSKKVKNIKWYLSATGYVKSGNGKTSKRLTFHRYILKMKDLDKRVVDHINGNPLDNRKKNLRICKQKQNTYNSPIKKNNKTGYIGVHFSKKRKRYISQIMIDGIGINLGEHEKLEEAVKVRLEAEKKYFGEFAPQKNLFNKYGIK